MKTKENYEDYSSGRVLQGYSGATNFPVGLAREIFEKCIEYLDVEKNSPPYTIYDPFCGVGYSLTVLGFFYADKIKSIYASDVDQESLDFAKKNLSLLSSSGLNHRINEIESMAEKYGKPSHREALASALRIKDKFKIEIPVKIFKADILTEAPAVKNIDIVISDIPYGGLTKWTSSDSQNNPAQLFLKNIKNTLSKKSIVAISYNRKQEIVYEGYAKVGSIKVPKRKIIFLKPVF